MPLKPVVKHSAPLYLRRTVPTPVRAGLWVCVVAGACVVAWACVGVAATPQNFPEASEDNHFIFKADGTYSFSYDTGSGDHQSFRIETRDSAGRVSGRFGYVDPDGVLRITEYQADTEGYRANMEIYHLVSWSPHSPLLVGPLPQHPTQLQDLPKLRERPQQTSSEPVGPSLFFPPQRPVLIIGPLPKPLQPARNQRDQMAPDLTEESLLGVSPDNLMPFPSSEFLQGPAIQDLSQIQPPEVLQDEILNTILQSTLEDVLQESVTPVLNNPDLNITLELFNETLQGIDLQTELPQPTLEDDYQDLQQGLRQTVMQIAVPETTGQPEGFTSTPLMVLSLTDNTSTSLASDNVNSSTVTILQQPTYNISFNAFSQVLSENSRENLTEKRQNNSQTTFSTVKSETTTQIPSTTITNTTTISQSSVPSTSLPVSSSGRGTSRTDQENDTAQSATFFVDKLPPVPPLTYLPVGDKRYDIPIDVFSQLPQEFIPFV